MAVTDLTNTKWKFNDSITATSGYGQFNLLTDKDDYTKVIGIGYKYNVANPSFIATTNSVVFGKSLGTQGSEIIYFQNTTDGVNFTSSIEGQTIEITGGADATNTNLISWLESNATQVKDAVVQIRPFLKGIADAIRTKKGTTDIINAQDFATEIASIETGGGLKGYNITITGSYTSFYLKILYGDGTNNSDSVQVTTDGGTFENVVAMEISGYSHIALITSNTKGIYTTDYGGNTLIFTKDTEFYIPDPIG